jgi:phage terminase large subunit GpA-like protein
MKTFVNRFKENGYCVVNSAISKELRDITTQYTLFDEMQDFHPEGVGMQVEHAHSKYGDPLMESILLHLQPIVEQHTGLELYPTYSYFRIYRKGDVLEPHTDRPACEISTTLCFNYSYDSTEYQWPIIMDGNPVILFPGDMVIYRGCDLVHSRDAMQLTDSDWHVQGFFHFVDQKGPFAEHKFDKRNSIGELSPKKKIQENKPYIIYL